jgi:hypothetical protein
VGSNDVPDVLGGVAELTACYTGTETEVANGNGIVLELVGKIIVALGHGTDEHTDTLLGPEGLDVVFDSYDWAFKGEGNLPAIGW